jgi:hypothetical protein
LWRFRLRRADAGAHVVRARRRARWKTGSTRWRMAEVLGRTTMTLDITDKGLAAWAAVEIK